MYRRHLDRSADAVWTGQTCLTRRSSPFGQPKFNGYLCRCRRCRGCSIVHGSSQKDDELVFGLFCGAVTSLIKNFCNFNLVFRLKRVFRESSHQGRFNEQEQSDDGCRRQEEKSPTTLEMEQSLRNRFSFCFPRTMTLGGALYRRGIAFDLASTRY